MYKLHALQLSLLQGLEDIVYVVRDNFDWRDLRGLGKLFAYGVEVTFQHARSTRWRSRRECRHSSSPSR